MNDELWNQWVADWHWITDAMHRHGCYSTPPEIAPPASLDEITTIEKTCGVTLPRDFVHIVTRHSAFVSLDWTSDRRDGSGLKKRFPPPFSCGFWGGGKQLWRVSECQRLYAGFQEMQETFPAEPTPYYASVWDDNMAQDFALWHNKIPLTEIPNGDWIAFDLLRGDGESFPLVYLSHDGSSNHGMRLADSFVEFITTWSRVGCVRPEDWKLEKFHDKSANKLVTDGELGDQFRASVNDPQPWFPDTV